MSPKEIEGEVWSVALLVGLTTWLLLDSVLWALVAAVLVGYLVGESLKKKRKDSDDE